MTIYIILTWISLTSAVRTSEFVATAFGEGMYTRMANELSDPTTGTYYSAIECGKACSRLHWNCRRYKFCQQEVGKAGSCTMYDSGEKCLLDKVTGSDCSCYMLKFIKEENGDCICPVGYYSTGDSCCQHVIKDCEAGNNQPHLKDRGFLLSFIKPDNHPGDPFEDMCFFGDEELIPT